MAKAGWSFSMAVCTCASFIRPVHGALDGADGVVAQSARIRSCCSGVAFSSPAAARRCSPCPVGRCSPCSVGRSDGGVGGAASSLAHPTSNSRTKATLSRSSAQTAEQAAEPLGPDDRNPVSFRRRKVSGVFELLQVTPRRGG